MGSEENAAVEANEGDLEDGDKSKVRELVGDENLWLLDTIAVISYRRLRRAFPKIIRVSGERSDMWVPFPPMVHPFHDISRRYPKLAECTLTEY